jgi:Arc/MetJ-type ribon-helix-helix transcriptional regulator
MAEKKTIIGVHLPEAKKRVHGMARAGGKFHAGNLTEVPEVQAMLGKFYEKRGDRTNVVMVRLGNDALAQIDELVDAGLVRSRSEGAAALIEAGIESHKAMFEGMAATTHEIRKLKQELRQKAMDALHLKTNEDGK